MLRKSALIAFLLLSLGLESAHARGRKRKAGGPEKMFFIELTQSGDSIQVGDVSVVKGRAKNDRSAGPGDAAGTEGSWYCEILGRDGKVAWSGFLPNPFLVPRPLPPVKEPVPDGKARTAVIRLPYRQAFAKASVFPTMAGPVPIPDRSKPVADITLAEAGEN